ncbi:MAG: GAF domain-containing sensor histidine kinase [Pseudomonadota bacterium]
MSEKNQLLHALLEINAISHRTRLSFERKLDDILHEIIGCMGAESGSIMLRKGPKNLEVVASTNQSLVGLKQPISENSPSSWVLKNRSPLRVNDIVKSGMFQRKFEHYHGTAFLLVPIMVNKKANGVLSVTDKIGNDTFSKEEQDVLLNISGQVISALENQRLSEALEKKKRVLQQKNLQLKKLETLKTDLFNMLIHDLKGPLSEIVANLDILSYTIKDENLDHVRAGQTGCDTLFRMVSNLLDIARLEEHRLELIMERLGPRELIRESIARMYTWADMKDIEVVGVYPPEAEGEPFSGDRDLLLRVLQNLLSNAIQHSPSGEKIFAGFRYPDSNTIEFFVRDNGPGIPPQHHETVFDKFKQLEKKADGRIYSTGLGLAFCKMAVGAHRGGIGIESDGIKGSVFHFALPLRQES